jgi:hypothetical protein
VSYQSVADLPKPLNDKVLRRQLRPQTENLAGVMIGSRLASHQVEGVSPSLIDLVGHDAIASRTVGRCSGDERFVLTTAVLVAGSISKTSGAVTTQLA